MGVMLNFTINSEIYFHSNYAENIDTFYVTKKEVIVKLLMITTMHIFMLSLLLQKGRFGLTETCTNRKHLHLVSMIV